ncbi:hypothetical protein BJ085DRAFT_17432 [Dimargaris cristalligena]|uniref:J domain-containing protein n=1 Tax=Dimargaris cristalligena TaxID=215637 RepID=A0A4Q0A128_9FUNG|nr:hypothetical protein BJ085DRAFT_17432 [Dimargaris cristalligena]|eukprot:RKP39806.1 hypothetical protein BJ085DRAFT_17432 [Dimargaris cristalligena]
MLVYPVILIHTLYLFLLFLDYTNTRKLLEPEDPTNQDTVYARLEKELHTGGSYYALLNVPTDASLEQIRDSYRRLCLLFHPDRQNSPEASHIARHQFEKIHLAYEVLSDPQRRLVYDELGEGGLFLTKDTQVTEQEKDTLLGAGVVGQRFKTRDELRREMERRILQQRQETLRHLIKSTGEIEIQVNAVPVLNYRPKDELFSDPLAQPPKEEQEEEGPVRLVQHGFDVPLTDQLSASLVGSITAGGQAMRADTIKMVLKHHQSSNLFTQYGVTLTQPRQISFQGQYQMGQQAFMNWKTTMSRPNRPPPASFTVGRVLSNRVTMMATFKTGTWSIGSWGRHPGLGGGTRRSPAPVSGNGLWLFPKASTSLCFVHNTRKTNTSVDVQAGLAESYLAGNYRRNLQPGVDLTGIVSLSNQSGLYCALGTENRVTAHSRLGWRLSFGFPMGIILQLQFSRLGQTVRVPVILTHSPSLRTLVLALAVPMVTSVALHQWVVKPRRRRQIRDQVDVLRDEFRDTLLTRRREAESTWEILRPLSAKKMAAETQSHGLVIVEAYYGHFGRPLNGSKTHGRGGPIAAAASSSSPRVIDVTIPVQYLVTDSRLLIHGGTSKADLVGFYDPCFGETKQLRVTYRFNDQLHTAIVDDQAPLACPLRCKLTDLILYPFVWTQGY